MSSAPESAHISSLVKGDGIRQQGRKKVSHNKLVLMLNVVVVVVAAVAFAVVV